MARKQAVTAADGRYPIRDVPLTGYKPIEDMTEAERDALVSDVHAGIARERVDHPPHYNANPSGVECITVVEHLNFNVGNAIKYLWRAGFKSKDPIEDLRKAAWYVNREIERLSRKG